MSIAIQFLETLGRGPALFGKHLGYFDAVDSLDVESAQRHALLSRNHDALSGLLGGRTKMMMQVWAPAEDMPQREDEQPMPDDGKEDEKPDGPPDR